MADRPDEINIALTALAAQQELLDLLSMQVQEGIIVADERGRIVRCNAAAGALLGWPPAEAITKPYDTVLRSHLPLALTPTPPQDGGGSQSPAPTLPHLGGGGFAATPHSAPSTQHLIETDVTTRDGKRRQLAVSVSGLHDAAGAIRGTLIVLRDVGSEREVERAKAALLATVGHELRTPLTGIRALSELLLDHDYDAAQRREIIAQIHSEAQRMARLVEQVLEVGNIEAGRLPFAPTQVDLATIVRQAATAIEAQGRTVRLHLPADLPPLWADPDRLRQIIDNLLANAAAYSDPASPLTISAVTVGERSGATRVRLSVRDEGQGIAPAEQSRIFERFYRTNDASDGGGGLGLGLYIVKSLAQMHGGVVGVESEAGKGSTFHVTLPTKEQQ